MKTRKTVTVATGFNMGTWDATFEAIAEARNKNRPKARKPYPVLVEHFTFEVHNFSKGKPAARSAASLELPRTKAAIERAASEWAKAHPGKAFTLVYRGWFDGTKCLPRYNSPMHRDDRVEQVVVFELPVYTHSGEQGMIHASAAEQAAEAVAAALAK